MNGPAASRTGADREPGGLPGGVEKLGFAPGQIVQEYGYDSDVDEDFRTAVEGVCGGELEDEEYTGEVDAVVLWWREDDGDLTDALVDTVAVLGDGGFVVLVTPKPGQPGQVEASEIDEAAVTAGLHGGGSASAGDGWRATKLASPRSRR